MEPSDSCAELFGALRVQGGMLAKLVQGTTVALLAVLGAQLAMRCLGVEGWFLPSLSVTVGVPSFLAALVCFPVGPKTLSSPWRLGGRALLFTAMVGLVNRLLVFRVFDAGSLNGLPRSLARVVPTHLDGNLTLVLASLVVAFVFAAAAQPLMVSVARQR